MLKQLAARDAGRASPTQTLMANIRRLRSRGGRASSAHPRAAARNIAPHQAGQPDGHSKKIDEGPSSAEGERRTTARLSSAASNPAQRRPRRRPEKELEAILSKTPSALDMLQIGSGIKHVRQNFELAEKRLNRDWRSTDDPRRTTTSGCWDDAAQADFNAALPEFESGHSRRSGSNPALPRGLACGG